MPDRADLRRRFLRRPWAVAILATASAGKRGVVRRDQVQNEAKEASKARADGPNVVRSGPEPSGRLPVQARFLLSLQSTVGNGAVAGVVQRRREEAGDADPDREPHENKTGLADHLKAGIESLSGVSLDDVEVHYNSSQPAQLGALAYAQGSDIHIAPGQEKHLPHEAWHVVQQAQERVSPNVQLSDVAINTDPALEREADEMGAKASLQSDSQMFSKEAAFGQPRAPSSAPTVQCEFAVRVGNFMVVVTDSALRHVAENAMRALIAHPDFAQAIAGQYQGQQVKNFHVRVGRAHVIVNIYPAGQHPAVVEVFHADDGYKEENRRKTYERFYGPEGGGTGAGSLVGTQ